MTGYAPPTPRRRDFAVSADGTRVAYEEHGPADSAHSLNGQTIAGIPLAARSPDAMGSDKFYRFMGTVQALFDAAADPAPAARAG